MKKSFFKDYGIRVVRIPNNEINNNFEGVSEHIGTLLEILPAEGETL